MSLALRYAARSDRGHVRSNNEDSVYAGPRLLAVADGMGGHAAGEVASKLAIAALEPLDEDTTSGDLLAALRQATENGSADIRELVNEDPSLEGMGTTLTALLFAGSKLGLCHIGDSRCYLMRDGELSQITKDDTFVQTLVDEGRITEAEAHVHPQRSLILRALNGSEVDPYLSIRESLAGDRYMICSDGLSDVVSLETMQEALTAAEPQDAADRLVELALRGGGPDNITCIVADIVDDRRGETTVQPVVDGAAGDNVGQRSVSDKTAAGRAALAAPPPAEAPSRPGNTMPPTRRGLLRPLLAVLLLALVLSAGIVALWRVSQAQWYVGAAGERVAVYRGMDVSVAGLSLSSVQFTSDLAVQDLTPAYQEAVHAGIAASDEDDATRKLEALRDRRLPECPAPADPTPTPTTTSPSTASSTPTTAATGSAPTGATSTTTGTSTTTSTTTPTTTTSAPTTTTSAAVTAAPVPGVDCREVR